jgi:hypothetical protein
MADHRDESGESCTRHAPSSPESLLALATIGSRMPGFHHDCASKLQSLMMSLDEISELADKSEMRQAVETAHTALRELHQLFQANRSLAKSPQLTRGTLGELIARSTERAGVKVRGNVMSIEIETSPPAMTHAISVLCDVVAGPSHLGRVIDIATAVEGDHVTISLGGPPAAAAKPPPNASELLAIAAYVIGRDGGELKCFGGGERFEVRILVAPTV